MHILFDDNSELLIALKNEPLKDDEYWLIMLADKHIPQLQNIVSLLNQANLRFFGATFPGLIRGKRMLYEGALARKVRCLAPPAIILLPAPSDEIDLHLPAYDTVPASGATCLTFIDCLSTGIDDFLSQVYNRFNKRCSYFGAGAGNSELAPEHSVFDNTGCHKNSAVVAIINNASDCVARHGWKRHSGPFVASRTTNNIVHELDWEDAEIVYREALPIKLKSTPPDRFYKDVTPRFPFAVEYPGDEDVVRDPIKLCGNGDVMFLSDIPQGGLLYLVEGTPEHLINAARSAVADAMQKKSSSILVCDCLSRTVALDSQFPAELRAISDQVASIQKDITVEGIVALGEIACNGDRPTNFYNKTFGICSFHAE